MKPKEQPFAISWILHPKRIWWLYALAAASFVTTLTLPYVGEEAAFTVMSFEMWQRGDWLVPSIYGGMFYRPPLFNWLIIPLASSLGWENVLIASRLIAASAAILSGLVLYWLVLRLFHDRRFAGFTALVYLSSDTLIYHGWLAYADPLFSFFVFCSIASLWIGCAEQKRGLLWLAILVATAAFLSKALTAYVFFGVTFIVLLTQREYRRFMLHPFSLLPYLAAIGALVCWYAFIPSGSGSAQGMLHDISSKLSVEGVLPYLTQMVTFPLEIFSRLLPLGGVALYFLIRNVREETETSSSQMHIALFILGLNFLPYWLSPQSGIRYIMPLYPLFALVIARIIWRAGERGLRVATAWLVTMIVIKFIMGLWLFPLYENRFRGHYESVAKNILDQTAGHPIYILDSSATGLSVAAHLDVLRYPLPFLRSPPPQWESGFVLAYTPDVSLGKQIARYPLGADGIYFYCRGSACEDASGRQPSPLH